MDISGLIRDASKVHASLLETADGALITKTGCKIYIPKRYEDRHLAVIANDIRIVAVYFIVVDDLYYGVSCANAMMQITPSSQSIVEIDGDEYWEFTFDKGAVITPNLELVKEDTLVYYLCEEIIAKGHIPWFFNYVDLGKLFTSARYHGNLALSPNNVALEMLVSAITRQSGDRTKYLRHAPDPYVEEQKHKPVFIGLRNVLLGATNTTAKLMGNYFDDGLLSSLVNPSEKVEGVETLLRM